MLASPSTWANATELSMVPSMGAHNRAEKVMVNSSDGMIDYYTRSRIGSRRNSAAAIGSRHDRALAAAEPVEPLRGRAGSSSDDRWALFRFAKRWLRLC